MALILLVPIQCQESFFILFFWTISFAGQRLFSKNRPSFCVAIFPYEKTFFPTYIQFIHCSPRGCNKFCVKNLCSILFSPARRVSIFLHSLSLFGLQMVAMKNTTATLTIPFLFDFPQWTTRARYNLSLFCVTFIELCECNSHQAQPS